MRKSVWELLNNRDLDVSEIDSLIEDIIQHISYRHYKGYYDIISNEFGFTSYEKLSLEIINKAKNRKERFLMLSELFLTSTKFYVKPNTRFTSSSINNKIESLEKRIYYYLNNLNYSISFNDESRKGNVHKNDELAETVSYNFITELADKYSAWRIISFHGASTNIQEKEDAIRALYLKLESIRQEYSNNQLFKDTKRLMNYFRHNKESGKLVPEIEANKEIFLDLAYDMFLQVFLNHFNTTEFKKHEDVIKKIK